MILKQDVVGVASRIVYGKKGDKVQCLKFQNEMIKVQKGNERPFFVRCYEVCDEDSQKTIICTAKNV